MTIPVRARVLWLLVVAPHVAAQTFVVDAANGAGANFTSIDAAVAAVPDGAVLIVRAGTYAPFTISGKALTILGPAFGSSPNVTVTSTAPGQVLVTNTSANQDVTLYGLRLVNVRLMFSNCQGLVHADGIWAPGSIPAGYLSGTSAGNCARLLFSHCSLGLSLSLGSCATVLEACTVSAIETRDEYVGGLGRCPWVTHWGAPGITVTGGSLQVRGSTIYGSSGAFDTCFGYELSPNPAISSNGAVRILDGTLIPGRTAGLFSTTYGPTLTGGPYRIDPETVFSTTPGASFVSEAMPSLSTDPAALGGQLRATVADPAGDPAIVILGFPGPPMTIAGLSDPIWLDPSFYQFLAFGTAPLTATLAVPVRPELRGFRVGWQAVTFATATGELRVSNPGVGLVR